MLITISNRLPVSAVRRDNGLVFESSVGGLATGLAQFSKTHPCAWVGWPGIALAGSEGREGQEIRKRLAKDSCHPVFLSGYEIDNHYHGFSNRTIWPLFHYFPLNAAYSKTYWAAYKKVNEKFAEEAARLVRAGDQIWIHDYHLLLLPELLRRRAPEATIGFFLHIPFPSFEIFRLLPWREELLRGLLGADLVGFHTFSYAHHFLESVSQILDIEHDQWQIPVENRAVKVDAFPMGIDFERFASAASRLKVREDLARISKRGSGRKIVLSVDRLDYTKGIPQRLEAFELFLEKNAAWRDKVTLILIAVPSRTAVPAYARLKKEVDELVGRINGRFGSIGWVPIQYLYRALPFEALSAYYLAADVALVTPLRDGMNLIAKEYLAARTDGSGVLILSEMAGASRELNDAILVNPNNREQIAEAIREALTLESGEQFERNRLMRRRIESYTVQRWAQDFLSELRRARKIVEELAARTLDDENRRGLLTRYRRARKRLLLLDYDGSLVSFVQKPEMAKPDPGLLGLLEALGNERGNLVVIVSGRDAPTLDGWFGGLNVGLIAEHGALLKPPGEEWREIEMLRQEWKHEIRGLLQQYADRTPGAFVEEKKFSLVWHYRKANDALAAYRARELKADLRPMTSEQDLEILEGNKLLEVRNRGVNKGRAVSRFLEMADWDFLLSVGDDRTDEDVFAVLPPSAFSLKIGAGPTSARFTLKGVETCRALLGQLGS
ncbi:MAG: bifunctional alpha,alpha-trehalose-phosphate synthase (UDP-forming)/trehalose-phosphatase [Candidatus Aminicenantes bacterium]|nr:bifunctional alpha,alpha-trehalose-phosphate synthase (UDP-forming)/trehalose-phosphatase [Candidatus Aminicenantes bacterium]